jgi:hypothetical protein
LSWVGHDRDDLDAAVRLRVLAPERPPPPPAEVAAEHLKDRTIAPAVMDLGFGRILASEKEAPIVLVNLV